MVAKSKDTGIDPEADDVSTVTEALRYYTLTIAEDDRPTASAELGRFVRWLGNDRSLDSLAPPEIGDYSDHIGAHGTAPDAPARRPQRALFWWQSGRNAPIFMCKRLTPTAGRQTVRGR